MKRRTPSISFNIFRLFEFQQLYYLRKYVIFNYIFCNTQVHVQFLGEIDHFQFFKKNKVLIGELSAYLLT